MMFEAGAVLIDQTMLADAARLLDSAPLHIDLTDFAVDDDKLRLRKLRNTLEMGMSWWPPTNAERLAHLELLLQGALMYETLYVLRGEVPFDVSRLNFRQSLFDSGIVRLLPASPDLSIEVSNELGTFLRGLKPHRRELRSHVRQISEVIESASEEVLAGDDSVDSSPLTSSSSGVSALLKGEAEGTLSHWWLDGNRLRKSPIIEVGEHLLDKIGYGGSGSQISGVSHLRTFVYWRTAARLGIPFHPSCRRIPQYEAFCRHVTSSVQDEVYSVVADAFKTLISAVYADEESVAMSVPPATSLFLDKIRRGIVPIEALLELRRDFVPLRTSLTALQSDLRGNGTIGDRLKAKRTLQSVSERLKDQYKLTPSRSIVSEVIDYAPTVISPLADPLSPGSYKAALVKEPVEWVQEWWLKRPFRLAFSMKDLLLQLKDFSNLTHDALGLDITDDELKQLARQIDDYKLLYNLDPDA